MALGVQRRCRMSDETPVETLSSIAQQIRVLAQSFRDFTQSVDQRFDGIDNRFEELKAQLRTEIESVRGDVRLVAEGLVAQYALNQQNQAEHAAFTERLSAHAARILVLEQKKPV